jgi:DNA-binding NarL/FixJ family response regulator
MELNMVDEKRNGVDKNNNELVTIAQENASKTLRELAKAIENGTVSRYKFSQENVGRICFQADSPDGTQRVIQTQQNANGYQRISTERIQKQSPVERRQIVKQLIDEGHTQSQIAQRTLYSQKTISNDVRRLREDNEL